MLSAGSALAHSNVRIALGFDRIVIPSVSSYNAGCSVKTPIVIGTSLRHLCNAAGCALASAMIKAFGAGEHDFAAVARLLEEWKVPRPSGESGPWTLQSLEQELHQINTSLDRAYAENGFGA